MTPSRPGGPTSLAPPGSAGQAVSIGYEDLTPEQREVVDATEATLLVGGGAGTGKTTTALWTARVQLTRPSTSAYKRVLFLTFSRTAVAQILSRARRVLVGIGDRVEILTFHGLAYRLLCQFGRYAGGPTVPLLRGESEAKLALAADSDGMLTYEELLPLALELLAPSNPVRELLLDRWSMVICDEFQDTDEEQWRLLELLGERARLVLLADPNQMIFGWRPGVDEPAFRPPGRGPGSASCYCLPPLTATRPRCSRRPPRTSAAAASTPPTCSGRSRGAGWWSTSASTPTFATRSWPTSSPPCRPPATPPSGCSPGPTRAPPT